MDSFLGRRSMHTLRKLPTARPKKANRNIKSISTGVYCGRIAGLKSIPVPMKSELLPGATSCVIIYGAVISGEPGTSKNRG
jgi:hypothetical protein